MLKIQMAWVSMWLGSGIAIAVASYATKSSSPLWALIIVGLCNLDFINLVKKENK